MHNGSYHIKEYDWLLMHLCVHHLNVAAGDDGAYVNPLYAVLHLMVLFRIALLYNVGARSFIEFW